MIQVERLTKKYGDKEAVSKVSFLIPDGAITGFLGPNGAGKSTTMRMILGMDNPTGGTALIDGKKYQDLATPLTVVGSLLDAKAVHPNRSAKNTLVALCYAGGINPSRADEVLEMVGLTSVANKRVGGFSLGMHQRLGLAGALLGNPQHIILDEPANGLDPEGIRWIRDFLKHLAVHQGKSVFVSSHQLGEISEIADNLVIIGSGKLKYSDTMESFMKSHGESRVRFVSPQAAHMFEILSKNNIEVSQLDKDTLSIKTDRVALIGDIAFNNNIPVYELSGTQVSLEEAFLKLTQDSAQYVSGGK